MFIQQENQETSRGGHMKKLLIWIILCSICTAMPVLGQEEGEETTAESYAEISLEYETETAQIEPIESLNLQEEPNCAVLADEESYTDSELYSEPSNPPQTEAELVKNRWGIVLTPAEIDLLARIVMLEAGGEGVLGQQAVTEVIFNRMVSSCYGGSLEHVLGARGQFSTWKNRYSSRAVPSQQVLVSVLSVLNGETNILPVNTLYFSRKAQNRRVQTKIGRHIFCNQ